MLKKLAIAAACTLFSSVASAAMVYNGTGTFIASNGMTGTWEQTVTVTSAGNGSHIEKTQTFRSGDQQRTFTFGYDLVGNSIGAYDIAVNRGTVGSAHCKGEACFYSTDVAIAGFDLDAAITSIGQTYKKIGTLQANWQGEDVKVWYEGDFSAAE
jgi:hypothetical protein